jgi:hypothetical protein
MINDMIWLKETLRKGIPVKLAFDSGIIDEISDWTKIFLDHFDDIENHCNICIERNLDWKNRATNLNNQIKEANEILSSLCNTGPIKWEDVYKAVKVLEEKR